MSDEGGRPQTADVVRKSAVHGGALACFTGESQGCGISKGADLGEKSWGRGERLAR